MTPANPPFHRLSARRKNALFGVLGSGRGAVRIAECGPGVGNRIRSHCFEQLPGEGVEIDLVGHACVADGMKDGDRAAYAVHPVTNHNPDGRRPSAHDFVHCHVWIDGIGSLHVRRLQRSHLKRQRRRGTLRPRKQTLCSPAPRHRCACPAKAKGIKVALHIPLCEAT